MLFHGVLGTWDSNSKEKRDFLHFHVNVECGCAMSGIIATEKRKAGRKERENKDLLLISSSSIKYNNSRDNNNFWSMK